MRSRTYYAMTLIILCAGMAFIARAQEPQKPSHDMKGMDAMDKRGNEVMGFDQMKTTHHFRLTSDGGVIQVEANDVNDTTSRDEIRMHLTHIAKMFADGDFKAPMLIHAQTPPGVPLMKSLKAEIDYKFAETERGGSVVIRTNNRKALQAVHKFLRFQIKEHKTGDSLEVLTPCSVLAGSRPTPCSQPTREDSYCSAEPERDRY